MVVSSHHWQLGSFSGCASPTTGNSAFWQGAPSLMARHCSARGGKGR